MKLALSILLMTMPLLAQEPPPTPMPPAMREISPGVIEIGAIRLEQKARTITFPGKLNLREGVIEYLLVSPQGSTHESLLVSEVAPADVHFAMLLLGAKGAGLRAPGPEAAPPPQIDAEYLKHAPELAGDAVLISVRWKAGDTVKNAAVEDWVINTATKQPAPRGPWVYNGSMFSGGKFLADLDGLHAALATNPAALINNPRKGRDDDHLWTVNTAVVPPVQTGVEITIRLLPPAGSAPPSPE